MGTYDSETSHALAGADRDALNLLGGWFRQALLVAGRGALAEVLNALRLVGSAESIERVL